MKDKVYKIRHTPTRLGFDGKTDAQKVLYRACMKESHVSGHEMRQGWSACKYCGSEFDFSV